MINSEDHLSVHSAVWRGSDPACLAGLKLLSSMTSTVDIHDTRSSAGDPQSPSAGLSNGPRESYLDSEGREDLSVLQDRMPPALRMSRGATLLVAFHALLFTVLSYMPLWHTDVWGHLAYGRWIVSHGRLPETEPLMPLCEGVPFINSAWLSQVTGYLIMSRFGVSGLMFLYAVGVTLSLATVSVLVYRRSGQAWAALLTSLLFYIIDYQQLLIIRPQLAGLVLFGATFAIVTSRRWRNSYYLAIPLLFALWANLHGSFIVGILMLGCLTVGRWADVTRRTKSWKALFRETQSRRLFLLTELACMATLLNPYGLGLLGEVWAVSRHPNFVDLIEWEPLTLKMSQGKAFFAAVLLLIVTYRFSPRRVGVGEGLLLAGLGLGALWSSRMIVWWAPVAAYYAGLHGAAIWAHWRKTPRQEPATAGVWSIASIGLVWICLAYTPFGMKVMHGKPSQPEEISRQFQKSVSARTPVAAVEFLKEHVPQGQVFNVYEWGDYLLWAGPPGINVFVASHAHLVPEEVWQDYMLIAYAGAGWEEKLSRYSVNTVIIDRAAQASLARNLAASPHWTKEREDGFSVIFVRKSPI